MEKLTATLDRRSADHALLCVSDGSVFDIYGETWAEMVDDANHCANFRGIEIVMFNAVPPEA